jgi:hypothetical protein
VVDLEEAAGLLTADGVACLLIDGVDADLLIAGLLALGAGLDFAAPPAFLPGCAIE